jgi:hypothetical protein
MPFPPVHGVAYSSPPPPLPPLNVHGVSYASPPPPTTPYKNNN